MVIFHSYVTVYQRVSHPAIEGSPRHSDPRGPPGIASARFKVKEISADLSNTMEAERQVLLTQEISWAHLKVLKKHGFFNGVLHGFYTLIHM